MANNLISSQNKQIHMNLTALTKIPFYHSEKGQWEQTGITTSQVYVGEKTY